MQTKVQTQAKTPLKAKVSISRDSNDRIKISIEENNSHIRFVEVSLSLEAFAAAVTGLSYQDADLEVRNLNNVGKFRVTEKRTILCPLKTYDRKEFENWLRENAQEECWIINTYLGSQSSISRLGDNTVLNYSVTKFVEKE